MGTRGRMSPDLYPDLMEWFSPATPSISPAWNDGIDRLSELPDVLRLHILSLLPLKSAIRTGVLSSRWRGLWAHRWPDPSSLFLFLSSQSTSSVLLPNAVGSGEEDAFVSTTNRFLAQRGRRRIDSFVLSFHHGQVLQSDLKQWVDYAAACSVEDFHLHVLPADPATSSASLSRRNNLNRRRYPCSLSFHFPMDSPLLTRLSLRGIHLSAANSASTRLEILALHSVTLTEAALRKVVAACPVLRCLDIRRCRDLRRIQISASGLLRSLTIVDCPKAAELVITSAPGLRSFQFCGTFLSRYSIENAHNLKEVYFTSSVPNISLPNSNWVSCFERLAHVTVLTLCSHALQYIAVRGAGTIGPMRSLYRLEELQLLMLMMSDNSLNDVFAFLKLYQCPVLERLFVELPTCTLDQHAHNYMEILDEEPPREDLDKLKMIKIRNYKGHYNEIRLVQFLLAKATNLSSLTVISSRENLENEYSDDPSDQLRFLHMQLSLIPKASENAQILFSESDIDGIQPTHSEAFFKF